MQTITAPELATWLNDPTRPAPFLLDVREMWEFDTCHIRGSHLMSMGTIADRVHELDQNANIVCICHHGSRSMRVASFLETQGFSHITNLTGGVHAWAMEADPSMPRY